MKLKPLFLNREQILRNQSEFAFIPLTKNNSFFELTNISSIKYLINDENKRTTQRLSMISTGLKCYLRTCYIYIYYCILNILSNCSAHKKEGLCLTLLSPAYPYFKPPLYDPMTDSSWFSVLLILLSPKSFSFPSDFLCSSF